MLENKNILIGITGAIAAYKICELVRMFKRENANVKIVLTPNAREFVSELTLETLSQNPVYTEQFKTTDKKPEHICLCDWADLFIIAPASANTISKIANGICDNLLTSLVCAYKKQILIAPSMNTGMWENKFVCENIKKLKSNNYEIIEPDDGYLACGTNGKGRLAGLEKIFNAAKKTLGKSEFLKGQKILITAGGTKENIDPVRYIGNYSSGKMGIALADKANEAGAKVTLISTVNLKRNYEIINVKTAKEMRESVIENSKSADLIIMAAAVADYRPIEVCEKKIKKENCDELVIKLVKNPDILAELGTIKTPEQKIVGFCAESNDLIANAESKIKRKNCDFIVANDISRSDIGFGSDLNEVIVIDKNLNATKIEKNTKENIAEQIYKIIFKRKIKNEKSYRGYRNNRTLRTAADR